MKRLLVLAGVLAWLGWWWLRPDNPQLQPTRPATHTGPTAQAEPIITAARSDGRPEASLRADPQQLNADCERFELERNSLHQQQQLLLSEIRQWLPPSQPLDWQLLVLTHPSLLFADRRWHSAVVAIEPPPPAEGIRAYRRRVELLDWLAALRKDVSAIPSGYASVSEFLETAIDERWAVKHLFITMVDNLPPELMKELLSQASWQTDDLPLIDLEDLRPNQEQWQTLFALLPDLDGYLAEQLPRCGSRTALLFLSRVPVGWPDLVAAWPLNAPPRWRWPLPSAIDLVLFDGPEAEPQLRHWQQMGLVSSLKAPDQPVLDLPLWPAPVSLRHPIPQPPPIAGWQQRQPENSYSSSELQAAAALRQQLEPLTTAINDLDRQLKQLDSQCRSWGEERRRALEDQLWSLHQQGFEPLELLGLDCSDTTQLPAIAAEDAGAAEYCRRYGQAEGAGSSLDSGQPLASWLAQIEAASNSGEVQPLLDHLRNDADLAMLLQLTSQYSPELLAPLLARGVQPTIGQLDWITGETAKRLLDAGLDFNQLAGEPSIYRQLALNQELDLATVELLLNAGVSERQQPDLRDTVDVLLEQLIRYPRRALLPPIIRLQPQLPARTSHWRRMAVLRERNRLLYQELAAAVPALAAAADQEPLAMGW
ncbi:MAG: hypothetical protein II007_11835 [Gammaproteobacteria bacterium]|nr:hypothetical protein [Gammaproteobacteria bacterium]